MSFKFVNRFAASSREATIPTRYVIANLSSYLYLDGRRRVAGTVNQFAIPTSQERLRCPSYNDYKYGMDKLNSYMQNIGVDRLRSQLVQREVIYLLGDRDTNPQDGSLDDDCSAMLQGRSRLERGSIFYNYIQVFYGSGITKKHSKVIVPGVGHASDDMFTSPQGIQAIFDQSANIPALLPSPSPYFQTGLSKSSSSRKQK